MAWITAGAAIGGALLSSQASKDAAGTQSGAAREANAAQERMFNKQQELQKPFRDAGLKANNRLMYLLGLGGGQQGENADRIYGDLLAQADREHIQKYGIGMDQSVQKYAVDAWKSELRRQAEAQAANNSGGPQNTQQDADYGSLMRSFGMQDFQADPGYAFRQSEGMKGVENSAAARGGLLSGAALKAIQKYGQDLASQEYGNAYQRFNADQTNKYNRLAGIVNTGQGATNQVGNAAANFGNAQASNLIGAGNAQAAGMVGSANAINSGIGQATNLYQQNQLMDLIRNPQKSGWGSAGGWTGGGRTVPDYPGAEY